MSGMPEEGEYCKICNKSFETWEQLFHHKIASNKHICCVFCSRDFRTRDGCNRHQHQDHAEVQDLKCAGCKASFVRAGSYISHIEQEQCPVIHHEVFRARLLRRDKLREAKEGATVVPTTVERTSFNVFNARDGAVTPTDDLGTGPIRFDSPSKHGSWDTWGDDDTQSASKIDVLKDFPALPTQVYRNGGSEIPDLLTGMPDKLTLENVAWVNEKKWNKDGVKPTPLPPKIMAAITVDPVTKDEKYHEHDPDNPKFNVRRYYNEFSGKYRCPWLGCPKSLNQGNGLVQHLRSPAHMDAKLRCPACLRQYSSATALVQHAESQAIKCQIRESNEYKAAVDHITGGFVDTAGRHRDDTVRYIAPPDAIIPGKGEGQATVVAANNAYWERQEDQRIEKIKEMAKNAEW